MSRVDALPTTQTLINSRQIQELEAREGAQRFTVSGSTGLLPMALRTRLGSGDPVETGTPYSTSTGHFFFAQRRGSEGRLEFKFAIFRSCSVGSQSIDHEASVEAAQSRSTLLQQLSGGWRAIPNGQTISAITFVNADDDQAMEVVVRMANGAGILINHNYRPPLRTGRRGILDRPSRCEGSRSAEALPGPAIQPSRTAVARRLRNQSAEHRSARPARRPHPMRTKPAVLHRLRAR